MKYIFIFLSLFFFDKPYAQVSYSFKRTDSTKKATLPPEIGFVDLNGNPQKFKIDSTTKFIDKNGKQIPFDVVLKIVELGSFKISPSFKNGNYTKEVVIESDVISLEAGNTEFPGVTINKSSGNTSSTSFSNIRPSGNAPKVMIGDAFPDFAVRDITGQVFKLSSFRGKVVVLNVWFIACKPCIMEMPELNQVYDSYKDKEVVFLAITPTDNTSAVKEFLQRTTFKYPIVSKDGGVKDIPPSFVHPEGFSAPQNLIIDRNGILVFKEIGYSLQTVVKLKNKLNEIL